MAKQNYSIAISIDTKTSTIHSFSIVGKNKNSITHQVKNYSCPYFDDTFFKIFKDTVSDFVKEVPSKSVRKISLILPDNMVAMDTINVPTMRSAAATKRALDATLGEIYRNFGDMKIQSFISAQNRQYTTFSTAAVQKRILTSIYSICSENKLLVNTTTYASSATVGALSALNPKLKNASYLFLDIKETYSRYIFVVNGRAVGFYYLPFGIDFITRPRYIQEDMLFDHTMGELTVLNAKEKAKAKKLTVLAEENNEGEVGMTVSEDSGAKESSLQIDGAEIVEKVTEENDETDEAEETDEPEETYGTENPGATEPFSMTVGQHIDTPKYMAKKMPRKIPKFMQRPIPESEEEITKENFRVFVKWALSLLGTNEKIVTLGAPSFVCVNLPQNLSEVLDSVNAEKEENGIEFRGIGVDCISPNILSNLDLYGGFFPKMIHPSNKF